MKWSYDLDGGDAAKEIATRKVSLDPYRIQSRRILALIKDALPKETQRVEKASIDEVFLDLSAQVHAVLLERYPELRGPAPYDDPSEPLPRPPTTALDWAADALVDLDASQSEEDDPDWDDICTLLASEIVRDVRKRVLDELHYTCSAGISRNKMLAKLGSSHKKPNGQTVIRNRAVQHFLSRFKFTKIRNLGGKLGDQVVAAFNTELVSELLPVPIEQLKKQLGDDTGAWLYGIIRGEDDSEVNPRTQIKSMLSAKSFRPSINSFEVASKWLRIFVADIFSRLVEEGVLENKRRPKTINLHHRQGADTRSKQAPVPMGRQITEEGLFDMAKNLLAQVIVDGRAWPCANLSLSVGGFEDGVTNNKGIGGFLVHGDEAKALRNQYNRRDGTNSRPVTPPPNKKRRVGENGGIAKFFGAPARTESAGSETEREPEGGRSEEPELEDVNEDEAGGKLHQISDDEHDRPRDQSESLPPSSVSLLDQIYSPPERASERPPSASRSADEPPQQFLDPAEFLQEQGFYACPRCGTQLTDHEKNEHIDFHFAQDLQNEHSSPPPPPPRPPSAKLARGGVSGSARAKGRGRPAKELAPERGQRRLAFG